MTGSHLQVAQVEARVEALSRGIDMLVAELLAAREVVEAARGLGDDLLLPMPRHAALHEALVNYDVVKKVMPLE